LNSFLKNNYEIFNKCDQKLPNRLFFIFFKNDQVKKIYRFFIGRCDKHRENIDKDCLQVDQKCKLEIMLLIKNNSENAGNAKQRTNQPGEEIKITRNRFLKKKPFLY